MIEFLFAIAVFAAPPDLEREWERSRLNKSELLSASWQGSSPEWEAKWRGHDVKVEAFRGDGEKLRARLAERVAEVRSLYEPFVDPYYPGVTGKIECPRVYRLVESRRGSLVLFQYFANSRKVPGACTKDTIRFQVERAIVLCPGASTLLDLTLYHTGKRTSQPWPDLHCRD